MPGTCSLSSGLIRLSVLTLFMVRLMDSTPPATMMSLQPEAIWLAAIAIACNPEEQKRLRVMPAVPVPNCESTATLRPML